MIEVAQDCDLNKYSVCVAQADCRESPHFLRALPCNFKDGDFHFNKHLVVQQKDEKFGAFDGRNVPDVP
jgi:hypothetical protein